MEVGREKRVAGTSLAMSNLCVSVRDGEWFDVEWEITLSGRQTRTPVREKEKNNERRGKRRKKEKKKKNNKEEKKEKLGEGKHVSPIGRSL